MADDALLNPPPPISNPTHLRADAATIQIIVPLTEDGGSVVSSMFMELDLATAPLGPQAKAALIDGVKRIARFLGKIA